MPQINTSTATRRAPLPLAGRAMDRSGVARAAASSADGAEAAPLATAEIVFSSGAGVQRYDWFRERNYIEELVVQDGAIRMGRLQRGAPLLNSHSSWDLEDQLGVVENPAIEAGQGTCRATFSRRESVAGYVQDVADKIIRNVSVGYVRHRIEMVPPAQEGGLWRYRVTDWEPYEVSLVPIPADMDSQIRSGAQPTNDKAPKRELRTWECEFVEVRATESPPTVGISAATSSKETTMTPEEIAAQQAAERAAQAEAVATASRAASQAAMTHASQRAAEITTLCARHGLTDLAPGFIIGDQTVDQVRASVLEKLAARDATAGGHQNVRIVTTRDEFATRMAGLEQAILHRVAPRTTLDDNGRQYRGMSLLELGRDFLEISGVSTRGMDRLTLATRMLTFRSPGMLTTGDFSTLFSNVATKRLRDAFDENPGTYALWARRAPDAPDFKNVTIAALSGAPDLLQTNEHGEFKYGTMKDGGETYGVITYGRIVSLTRQAIINDDLRAFDRLVTAFGYSARRLENRLVYAQLTANAALSDTVALFHATHGNLGTGAGSALQFSSLQTARAAMRVQKGMQSEELNLAPKYLIVPAALEQTAYQFTSSNYVPAKPSDVNEFRQGGRTAVEPVIEPLLDASSATAWYLAANSGQVDTVEYMYLAGAEGPVIESEMGFEVDGISWKCREDFAAKAIDYRGLYKANGA